MVSEMSFLPVPTPLKIEGSLASNWKSFRRQWESYEIASGLDKKTGPVKAATLITCLGQDGIAILEGLQFDNEEDKKVESIILEKLEEYCVGELNEIAER